MPDFKKILVAPLDWGWGHTSRCVPIIRAILNAGHQIIFAGNDNQIQFIKNIFPQIQNVKIDGYDIHYGRSKIQTHWQLFRQLPHIKNCVKKEHNWLKHFLTQHSIDGIISDNRYGLFHEKINSLILTHQLHPQTGFGKIADHIAQHQCRKWLKNFNEIWVVDNEKDDLSLSGKLSRPAWSDMPIRYIGWLSAMEKNNFRPQNLTAQSPLVILLSGVEPQRSILSELLWQKALTSQHPIIFIEGKKNVTRSAPPHLQHFDMLAGAALEKILLKAKTVVCRSGYSTLMDLRLMQVPAILIPTPGQGEQEYLGQLLNHKYGFKTVCQEQISTLDLDGIGHETIDPAPESHQYFKGYLKNWLQLL